MEELSQNINRAKQEVKQMRKEKIEAINELEAANEKIEK